MLSKKCFLCAGSWTRTQSAQTASSTLTRPRAVFSRCTKPDGAIAAQLQGNTKEATTFTAAFSMDRGRARRQDRRRLARSVLDGSFNELAMNKPWRRQSSAEWAARAVKDLCDANQVWATGWRRLRAHGDAHFKEAVEEAAALHAHDELFARHVAPEPAEEGPPMWAMAEESDDEGADDAPMPDAPLEPEVIDMPPARASAPRMSKLERCMTLRLVWEERWPQMVSTRGDFCPHACALRGQPIVILRVSARFSVRMLGYVLVGQRTVISRRTNECLDMCTSINRS